MSNKTMKQSQDWRKNYDWTDKNDHPVHVEKFEDNEFQPKVLKDQVVKFYKKPKRMKNGYVSYGVIEGWPSLFPKKEEAAK